MHIHTIHRFHLDPASFDVLGTQAHAQGVFFAIEPVAHGMVRMVMQASGDRGASLVFSRMAHYDSPFPQQHYRWWKLTVDDDRGEFFDAFMQNTALAIASVNENECVLDMGGLTARMSRVDKPKLLYGDPRRLGLASDPTFEVESAPFFEAISLLRGRGRVVPGQVAIDVLIHASMPVRHDGVDLAHVRVLTLKRADNQARIDIVAKCSPVLLESSGIRFSLAPLATALQTLRAAMPGDLSLLSVGFDIDERVVWVGKADDHCAAYCWKTDTSMQSMSTNSSPLS
jgi:hypothetical protein